MVDSLNICVHGDDKYPGSDAINTWGAVSVAMYTMLLFNLFIFDIYKWEVFIISSN